jgi:hypothetical protein
MSKFLLATALTVGLAAPALADDHGYGRDGQDYGQNHSGTDDDGYYRGGRDRDGYRGKPRVRYDRNNGSGYGRGNDYYARPVVRYRPAYRAPVYYPPAYYGGGYGGGVTVTYGNAYQEAYAAPVYVAPVYAQPVYVQPLYAAPVVYGQPYPQPGYAVPVNGRDPCRSWGAGAVIGAIAGGLIGNGVAGHRDRGLGTVIGAGLGAVTGTAIERNQRCGY